MNAEKRSDCRVTRRACLVLPALLFVGAGARAASLPLAGRVVEVRGTATAESDQDRRVLSPDSSIHVGEKISTAEQSRVELQLGETKLRLGDNGDIKINRFEESGGEITLGEGPLLLDKPSKSLPRSVRVDGASAMITARGSKFFAGPSQGVFGVLVVEGEVEVRAGGRSVRLRAGEGTDIKSAGAQPTPPRRWGKPRVQAALASVG